jgi:signal peptidase I
MLADLALAAGFAATVLLGTALRRAFLLVRVEGASMEPALRAGDRVLVRRIRGDRVRRGQVVVVAEADARLTIKRAAAVPGDPVPHEVARTLGEPVVPAGRLVLLGDNRARSRDSRAVGYFGTDRLLGVVANCFCRPPDPAPAAQAPP